MSVFDLRSKSSLKKFAPSVSPITVTVDEAARLSNVPVPAAIVRSIPAVVVALRTKMVRVSPGFGIPGTEDWANPTLHRNAIP